MSDPKYGLLGQFCKALEKTVHDYRLSHPISNERAERIGERKGNRAERQTARKQSKPLITFGGKNPTEQSKFIQWVLKSDDDKAADRSSNRADRKIAKAKRKSYQEHQIKGDYAKRLEKAAKEAEKARQARAKNS